MTYGQFLVLFLAVPLGALALLMLREWRRTVADDQRLRQWTSLVVLAGLTIVATVYTFPWDNHLIAMGVWWYSPERVSGVALGNVPVEELLFFPLQTLLIGLWVAWLAPHMAPHMAPPGSGGGMFVSDAERGDTSMKRARGMSATLTLAHPLPQTRVQRSGAAVARWVAVLGGIIVWLAALVMLLRGWAPGVYLGWELVWALPPLMLQVALGGDILWRRRRILATALAPAVLFLCLADAVAIHEGIWTISRHWSLGLLLGGLLPLEELVFFLLTSTLVAAGLLLGGEPEMRNRLHLGHVERS